MDWRTNGLLADVFDYTNTITTFGVETVYEHEEFRTNTDLAKSGPGRPAHRRSAGHAHRSLSCDRPDSRSKGT